MRLTEQEEGWLRGESGKAHQLAMRLMVAAGEATGANELIDIEFAHINSCHYSGQLSVDFAEFLLREGARLAVPTHTNASLIDCAQPDFRSVADAPEAVAGAQRLMAIYEELGCSSMWSCAPYQQADGRPIFGQQIVGSESNAVSFFNSALGARTNKYGDMLDVSAAIVGRVPLAGLHTDEGRAGTHVFTLDLPDEVFDDPTLPHLLGIVVGQRAGSAVPVIDGLPNATEDDLKAIAAAAATSGSVEMFHVVGLTPEAPTLDDATGSRKPKETTRLDVEVLNATRVELSSATSTQLDAVCLGTPHFSITEFEQLRDALRGRTVHPSIDLVVTTSRAVRSELQLRGWVDELTSAGVQLVLDTCSYYPPRGLGIAGTVMTNSAKWAYYAPGMLDVQVAFGSLHDCVESSVVGEIVLGSSG